MMPPDSNQPAPLERPFIPYPPLERHGVIGDRRTAALVAADGAIDWLCLPDYESSPIFGSLLDVQRGGFWRLGPANPTLGRQRYEAGGAVLTTIWRMDEGELTLTDAMAWPSDDRPPGDAACRVLIRHLRCSGGVCDSMMHVQPRAGFDAVAGLEACEGGLTLALGNHRLGFWTTLPLRRSTDRAEAVFHLQAGEEAWAVLAWDEDPADWSVSAAMDALTETRGAWRSWDERVIYTGPRGDRVRRAALTVRLLAYAPSGALVAAPTTSLPERIGGHLNYDYRFAWIRDASLSLAVLALLGDTSAAERYMDWLVSLESSTDSPLQIVYRVDGGTDLAERTLPDLDGYRGSRPVRIGNHAATQRQLDSLGYLADCALIYLKQGGAWSDRHWRMIRAAADYTVENWRLPDSGIWELTPEQHFLSSKVMSWVALDRAVKLARATGGDGDAERWTETMATIHAEVMERGWSDRRRAFTQRYEGDNLDASALLIPLMGFLPAAHPRVIATVNRIAECLTIDGFVHRFIASETPGHPDLPLGAFEGAFLPCTFWLAATYAKLGRTDDADAMLQRAEAAAGELGLFAEEVDAPSRAFLGNTPLLFSQVEYVRAVLELAKARPLDRLRLMAGMVEQRVDRLAADLRNRLPGASPRG